MPMIIGSAPAPIPSPVVVNRVGVIEPHPRPAARCRAQHERIADAVRALQRRIRASDGKLNDHPWSDQKRRAVQDQQRLKIAFIHGLT